MNQSAERRVVNCEGGVITYLLTRKPVKNVNLRIRPDGQIFVSANQRVPVAFIDGFVEEKQRFIFSALAKCEKRRRNESQSKERKYVSGEEYRLLGKNLSLIVQESKEEKVYVDGNCLFLKVKNKEDFRHKEICMEQWERQYQKKLFEEIIQSTYNQFREYGVPYPELKIRKMKARWGSCQPKKGVITLNSHLIEKSYEAIEYVVVHEFAHFIHPNHSKQFWEFVERMMPDWKERKKGLE